MYCTVLITTKNLKEAKRIARELLELKLIACANIIKDIESLFWWDGKVQNSKEVLLVLKTKKSVFKNIVKVVKDIHSYDVPEIIALPIIAGYNSYLNWVNQSISKGKT